MRPTSSALAALQVLSLIITPQLGNAFSVVSPTTTRTTATTTTTTATTSTCTYNNVFVPYSSSSSSSSSSSLSKTTTTAKKFYNNSTIINNKNNPQIDVKTAKLQQYSQEEEEENIMQSHLFKEEDIILNCSDGVQLAAKRWSSFTSSDKNTTSTASNVVTKKRKILCLHGWLDNGASFHIVGPEIIKQLGGSSDGDMNDIDIVAIDLPGHGFSSHKSPDGPPQLLSEYVLYTAEALHSLNWIDVDNGRNNNINSNTQGNTDGSGERIGEGITLIGHSMGAGLVVLFAAAYPEYVNSIILLEGLGPVARKSVDAAQHARNAIQRRITSNRKLYPELSEGGDGEINNNDRINRSQGHRGKKKYVNLESAISARMKTAALSPGEQRISKEAATALVGRAAIQADQPFNPSKAGGKEIHPSTYDGPIYFRHDSRLMWPSLQYLTEEQVQALLNDAQCPSCLIVAEDG